MNANYSSYDLWLGRAFLLLGDIYTAQRDYFQARATLNSIIENKFPVAEIVEGARQRLKALPASDDEAAPAPEGPVKTAPAKVTPAAPTKATPPAKTTPAPTKVPTRPAGTRP